MRALLVVNPCATTTTTGTRNVLVSALASDLKLDVAETRHRGHAIELARDAVRDGFDVLVVLGGDGTVNEVVNGLLSSPPGRAIPALGVVPGGGTNVFPRALGLPREPVEATAVLLDALHEGRRRVVGLGMADDRYFTFCAGLGFDAEVVRTVEARRRRGRRPTSALYVRIAVEHFFTATDRRHPTAVLERPGADPVPGLYLGIVANAAPWTYLGARPVNPCPRASFDLGLDLFALRRLGLASTLRHVRQILSKSGRPPHGRDVVALHDLTRFTLRTHRPLALHVDGEYLGEREVVTFRSRPRTLRVVV